MGLRTRFEEDLRESNPGPSRELLSIDELPASTSVASALALTPGDPVTLVTVLAIAEEARALHMPPQDDVFEVGVVLQYARQAHGTRSQTNGIQIRQEKTPTNETGPY
jgi:hypothetical protein